MIQGNMLDLSMFSEGLKILMSNRSPASRAGHGEMCVQSISGSSETRVMADLTNADVWSGLVAYAVYKSSIHDSLRPAQNIVRSTVDLISNAISVDLLIEIGYLGQRAREDVQSSPPCVSIAGFNDEDWLQLEVARVFKSNAQVDAVYVDEYMGLKRFLVILLNEKHDNALMDELIGLERDLRLKYLHIACSFSYIPRLFEVIDEVVPADATLLYKKGANVIIASASLAGQEERTVSHGVAGHS